MANTCIVVANEPRAYREAFAAVLHELRPHVEVICIEPDDLDGMVAHGRPRLVLCSRLTEALQMCCDAWILLYPNGENRALISVAGRRNVVTSIALSDLLSVIDELYRFGAIAARNLQEERENDDTVGGDDESVDRPDPLAGNGQGAV